MTPGFIEFVGVPDALGAGPTGDVVGAAPEDQAVVFMVKAHHDIGVIADPPAPVPGIVLVEFGVERAEFAFAGRSYWQLADRPRGRRDLPGG